MLVLRGKRLLSPGSSVGLFVGKTSDFALFVRFHPQQISMAPLPRLSVDINLRESPEDQPLSGYESADEDEVSRYKLLWTNVMEEGTYRNPSLYQKVHVLLLQWAKTDIDTTKEVEDLQAVFENEFGYNTTMVYLDANSEKKLQVQLNASVANFVHGHDGDNTLLIVYYAGHGRPGEFHGHLELMGYARVVDRVSTANPFWKRVGTQARTTVGTCVSGKETVWCGMEQRNC